MHICIGMKHDFQVILIYLFLLLYLILSNSYSPIYWEYIFDKLDHQLGLTNEWIDKAYKDSNQYYS